jgi:hypothetical protein
MDLIGCDHVVEYGQTEAFLGLEDPVQVAVPIARSEKSGILSVSLLNGLNGAERLNDLNDWNELPMK